MATTIIITTDYDGQITSTDIKSDNIITVAVGGKVAKTTYRSFYRFPLAALPADKNVTNARFRLNIITSDAPAGLWDVHAYDTNGQTDPSGESSYAHCASGNLYVDDDITWRNLGQTWITLGGNVCTDIENAKSAVNRFSLGCHEEGDNDNSPIAETIETVGGSPAQLEITYEDVVPPAAVLRRLLVGVGL